MQKPIASLMVVGLLLLAACGTGDTVEPGPITSFEDIAGTIYENQTRLYFAGYLQFSEDGTWHGSSSRDLVEDLPGEIWESRFEGTKVFLKQTKGICKDNPDAIYEIHLLENGNLQLVAIEDMCLRRLGPLDGAEYAPVP